MSTTTKGTDVCMAVKESLDEKEIDLGQVVSITTDGTPNIVRKKLVLSEHFNTYRTPNSWKYCIIHQQVLGAKCGCTSIEITNSLK